MGFVGKYFAPGDKSITHRALILSSMVRGVCQIQNALISEDTISTVYCLRSMGVDIEVLKERNLYLVHGVGKYGFQKPKFALDCGNSGTTMRLLSGLLAAQPFSSTLIGDASLMERPMERVVKPLRLMGANISLTEKGTAPICIQPSEGLREIEYRMEVPSAQVMSAIQLASCYTPCFSKVLCEQTIRDHTEILLQEYRKRSYLPEIKIPGDFSSAAFFMVGAVLSEGSDLYVENVGLNEGRIGLLKILERMGAKIDILGQSHHQGERVGSLRVQSSSLSACIVTEDEIPSTVDEVPLLAIAAAFAQGRTEIRGVGELRVKESDRLHSISKLLTVLNVRHGIEEDDLWIEGTGRNGIQGTTRNLDSIDFFSDHRLSMCRAILHYVFDKDIVPEKSVDISYPDFYKDLRALTAKSDLKEGL